MTRPVLLSPPDVGRLPKEELRKLAELDDAALQEVGQRGRRYLQDNRVARCRPCPWSGR